MSEAERLRALIADYVTSRRMVEAYRHSHYVGSVLPAALIALVESQATPMLQRLYSIHNKKEREKVQAEEAKAIIEEFSREDRTPRFSKADVKSALETVTSAFMRAKIFETGVRWDGRSNTDIRPIFIEQSLLPRTHGSALFTRGETQSIAICVLGGEQMAQRYEDLHGEGNQRFYMQYFFPPFSVGEVGRIGSPGRREIGHGKLAERALMATLPSKEEFPYIIRLESNITESNGSSSMASVCGGCLALMEAGVPIKRPVSGIAMGLLLDKDRCVILSPTSSALKMRSATWTLRSRAIRPGSQPSRWTSRLKASRSRSCGEL